MKTQETTKCLIHITTTKIKNNLNLMKHIFTTKEILKEWCEKNLCRLRLIKTNGDWISNKCGIIENGGTPMVGCKYCRQQCPHHKGITKFLFWEFVKCNKNWEA